MHQQFRNIHIPTTISSGSFYLDAALGIDGFPRGAISEIVGPECSGKTVLCLHLIAEAQKQGQQCVLIDCDHSLSEPFARKCGVNSDLLLISRPTSAEQALGIVETLVNSGELPLAIIDSVDSLISESIGQETDIDPTGEIYTELDSWRLRRLASMAKKSNTAVIFTRQEQRSKSVIYHRLSDHLDHLSLSFVSSLRLQTNCMEIIKENGVPKGLKLQIRIIKNQFFHRTYTTVINLMYNQGTTKAGELFDLSNKCSLINKRNRAYFFQDQCLGRERTEVIEFLRNNTTFSEKIEQVLRQRLILTGKVQIEN